MLSSFQALEAFLTSRALQILLSERSWMSRLRRRIFGEVEKLTSATLTRNLFDFVEVMAPLRKPLLERVKIAKRAIRQDTVFVAVSTNTPRGIAEQKRTLDILDKLGLSLSATFWNRSKRAGSYAGKNFRLASFGHEIRTIEDVRSLLQT